MNKVPKTALTVGIETITDNKVVAAKADILFLAVKPYMFADVIPQIKDEIKDVIAIADEIYKTLSELYPTYTTQLSEIKETSK